jgi:glycine cleavage system aminomethyltransferase T
MPTESPLRALHQAASAKLGEYFETILPSAFTTPAEEYRFACESVAVADKNCRAFFIFTGPDRARYLNAVLKIGRAHV